MKCTRPICLAAAVASLGAWGSLARADGVEIDHFRIWVERDAAGWLFTIDHEVEVDDYVVPALELVVTLEYQGQVVANAAGQQVQFVLPLGGTDHDEDDAEFEGRTAMSVTDLPALPVDGLDAVASVYAPGNDYPYATRRAHVRFVRPEVVVYEVTVAQQPVVYYQPGVVVYRTAHVSAAPAYVTPAPVYSAPAGQPSNAPVAPPAVSPPPANNTGPRYVAPGPRHYADRRAGITYDDGQHEAGVTSTPPPVPDRVPRRQIIPPGPPPGYAGGYPQAEEDPDSDR